MASDKLSMSTSFWFLGAKTHDSRVHFMLKVCAVVSERLQPFQVRIMKWDVCRRAAVSGLPGWIGWGGGCWRGGRVVLRCGSGFGRLAAPAAHHPAGREHWWGPGAWYHRRYCRDFLCFPKCVGRPLHSFNLDTFCLLMTSIMFLTIVSDGFTNVMDLFYPCCIFPPHFQLVCNDWIVYTVVLQGFKVSRCFGSGSKKK